MEIDPKEIFFANGVKVMMINDGIIFGGEKIIDLGSYVIKEKLGCGTFASVYRAKHKITRRNVALKIIRNNIENNTKKNQERIELEFKSLLKFNHPHIVKCYDRFKFRGLDCIVLEYVDGEELFDFIVRSGKISENKARLIFQQLVSGVDYMHKNGVLHRDLKPENILITGNCIKIVDFGLSNQVDPGSLLESSVGSPNYAAPELIEGRQYNNSVDIWSIGCILFALCAGRLPFEARQFFVLFKLIKSADYKMEKFFSSDLKNLIKKIFVVDPSQRWSLDRIRNHRWITKSYLPYLQKVFSVNCAHNAEKIDKEVFNDALKIHYDDDDEINNNNITPKEGKKIIFEECHENSFFVTYNILKIENLNSLLRIRLKRLDVRHANDPIVKKLEEEDERREKIKKYLRWQQMGESLTGHNKEEDKKRRIKSSLDEQSSRSDGNWNRGIIFKNLDFSPDEVFDKVYDSLEECGILWSTINDNNNNNNTTTTTTTKMYYIKFRAILDDPDGERISVSFKDIVAYGTTKLEFFVDENKNSKKIGYRIIMQYTEGNYLFFTSLMQKFNYKLSKNLNLLVNNPLSKKNKNKKYNNVNNLETPPTTIVSRKKKNRVIRRRKRSHSVQIKKRIRRKKR